MSQFIRINDKVFPLQEVARALGIEQVKSFALCQAVQSVTISASFSAIEDEPYPGIDLSLELPAAQNSLPVILARSMQPHNESLRTYLYERETYFAYHNVDTRPDSEAESNPMPCDLVVCPDTDFDVVLTFET